MSQQGPILFVCSAERLPLAVALDDCKLFPLIDSNWADAADAVERLMPAAVIADISSSDDYALKTLADKAGSMPLYTPMIGIDPIGEMPASILPYSSGRGFDGLLARLNAALRVRTLHATIERRVADSSTQVGLPQSDPLDDATVLLVGRGASYPSLSVALGERVAVIGSLSLEAAIGHLNARDLDGVVIGAGFSARMLDNFITTLADDTRFRHLPVIVSGLPVESLGNQPALANLESTTGNATTVTMTALPFIRQHALDTRLARALKSIESGGLLDPRSGLMTEIAFGREFASAVTDSMARGAGLSAARFQFDTANERARLDAARILSRLMRRFDFATLHDDGSITAAFAETDLRGAHVIARRIASVVKHTMHAARREAPVDPRVSVATLLAKDTPDGLLARLQSNDQRAAS